MSLNFRYQPALFIVLIFHMLAVSMYAQRVQIQGTVLDANSHRPIADVNVMVEHTASGTSSDTRGRFSFAHSPADTAIIIVFRHLSYEELQVPLREIRSNGTISLRPRIIPLQTTEITGKQRTGIASRDIRQTVETIEARDFEGRGYIDAGDVLRDDHGIHVDESFSGRKTLSIRGGNADDVLVLYDGVKLNGSHTHVFDMALIDISDIDRFEIVRSGNSALYGSDAFGGIVNIVPKNDRAYNIRVHQQIGSYDSGLWGLQLFQKRGDVSGFYSVRNGGMRRSFDDIPEEQLINSTLHHNAGFTWNVTDNSGIHTGKLSLNWRNARLDFENERDTERLRDNSHLASGQYHGSLFGVNDVTLMAGWTRLEHDLAITSGVQSIERVADEQALQTRLEKNWIAGIFELLLSWQFARNALDYKDSRKNTRAQPVGFETAEMTRNSHAFVAIGKMRGETGSDFLRSFDVDVSVRHDQLRDALGNATSREGHRGQSFPEQRHWSGTTLKLAVGITGITDDMLLDVFLGYGGGIKYPTLFQQMNSPVLIDPEAKFDALVPERQRGVEIGVSLIRSLSSDVIAGWECKGSVFQNVYSNKMRSITSPGLPITLFDNVDDASITGLEGKAGLYFFGKKVLAEAAISHYFISDQAAFPFKAASKYTFGLNFNHAGYSLQVLVFREGEQVGVLRGTDGGFAQTSLPEFHNIDMHAGVMFTVGGLGAFANVSMRNMLSDSELLLSGLALRDRRYYITVGLQY